MVTANRKAPAVKMKIAPGELTKQTRARQARSASNRKINGRDSVNRKAWRTARMKTASTNPFHRVVIRARMHNRIKKTKAKLK